MNRTAVRNRVFTDKMFYRLFVPSVASAVGLALGDIADALFVGIRLGNLGLATMSIVVPIYMIFNTLDVGIGVSASVEYSRCLGKGKAADGISIFSQMGLLTLAVSVLLGGGGLLLMPYVLNALGVTAADAALYRYTEEYLRIMFLGAPLTFLYFYLYFCIRCDDGEKLASLGYTVGYLTDIVASVVFVLVLKWDVKGAILATVLGKFVGVVIFSFHFTRRWAILRFKWTKFQPKRILQTLKIGLSSSVGYLFQFVVFLIVNNILMRMNGNTAVAEYNVVQNVSYFAMAIYTALGETVQPLCSTFFAEHNQAAIRRVLSLAMRIGCIVGGIVSALFIVCAPYVCRFFGLSTEAVAGGSHAVALFCLSVLPAGASVLTVYGYQAMRREKEAFFINLMRTFSFAVLFAAALSFAPAPYFWLYFLLTEVGCLATWIPLARKRNRALETQMQNEVFSYLLDNADHDISHLLGKVEAFCEQKDVSPKTMYYVNICIEEMCQAIIENAFKGEGEEYIQITVAAADGKVSIHIRDNAVTFNPFDMKTGQNYFEDEDDIASLGIQMVKTKANGFFYRRYSGFNTLTVEL